MMRRWVIATLAIGVALATASRASGAGLDLVGQLSIPPSTSRLFGGMVASGPVLGAVGGDGNGYVFSEPAGGWASEPASAELLAPDPTLEPLWALGVSPSTIVASFEPAPGSPEYEEVYGEPAGGWVGSVTPSARLIDSGDVDGPGGVPLGPALVDQNMVFASAFDSTTAADTGCIDVFVEPPGGWAGDVTQSARLEDPGNRFVELLAETPGTVVVEAQGEDGEHAVVFTEPAGGWSGTITPTATLDTRADPQGSAPASSPVIAVGDDVFAEPGTGWRGTLPPVARLLADGMQSQPAASMENGTAIMTGCRHVGSPDSGCGLYTWLFDPVEGQWTGSILAHPVLPTGEVTAYSATPAPLLADADTLMVGSLDGQIAIYRLPPTPFGHAFTPGRPQLTETSLTGLGDDSASLDLRLQIAKYAPVVGALVLQLPAGLRFDPRHLLAITGSANLKCSLQHNRLRIVLTAVGKTAIDMDPGSIIETRSFREHFAHASANRPGARVGTLIAHLRSDGHTTIRRLQLHVIHQ